MLCPWVVAVANPRAGWDGPRRTGSHSSSNGTVHNHHTATRSTCQIVGMHTAHACRGASPWTGRGQCACACIDISKSKRLWHTTKRAHHNTHKPQRSPNMRAGQKPGVCGTSDNNIAPHLLPRHRKTDGTCSVVLCTRSSPSFQASSPDGASADVRCSRNGSNTTPQQITHKHDCVIYTTSAATPPHPWCNKKDA